MKGEYKAKGRLTSGLAELRRRIAGLGTIEAEGKRMAIRMEHLNLVLRAIRSVNRLIVREKDRDQLLQFACDTLIEIRGYHDAWIVLTDESGGLVTTAEAGLGQDFTPLAERLERGELTACGRSALAQSGVVMTKDPASTCPDCPLSAKHSGRGVMIVRLEHAGKIYGLLTVSIPADLVADEKERALLKEVAGDIAFALYSIELEQARKRAEESLRENEQFLQNVFDGIQDGISVLDSDLNIIRVNSWMERMYESQMPLPGKKCYSAYQQRKSPCPWCPPLSTLKTGESHSEIVPYPSEENPTGWIDLAAFPFKDVTGRVVGIIEHVKDISERVRAEEEIRCRNRELTLLNRVIAASAAGQDIKSILKTVCRELALAFDVPQVTAAMLNEDKTESVVVAEYLTEGQPSALNETISVAGNPSSQYLLTRKSPLVVADAQNDPRLAPIHELMRRRGTVSLLLVPLVVEGEVVGSLGLDAIEPRHFSDDKVNLARHVADQVAGVLARARLTQTHQHLITAIEQVAESVVITDAKGDIIYVNPAFEQITGYTRAEALGRNPNILKSGEHNTAFYEQLWATIGAGEVWHGSFINRRKDGTLYTEEATISPVRNEDGLIVSYVAIERDVTREMDLEERYRQSQKMEAMGRLAGGVAHDFNNVLTAIQGYAQFLLGDFSSDDVQDWPSGQAIRADLGEILGASRRAAALTQQLLIFSRRQVLQPRVLNLNTVLDNMEKMLRRLIGEDIELVVVLGPTLGYVKADPGQIEQVIMNLSINARDAMPGGGRLTFETANVTLSEIYAHTHPEVEPGVYVRLTVTDTGAGMTEEVKAHLFEPFFTTKEEGKGTGLGLATVYGIVEQSGGHIDVYSELGVGTTFEMYLPRIEEDGGTVEREQPCQALFGGTEIVLLVEDEEMVRKTARRILEQCGYTVLEAQCSQDALSISEKHSEPIHLLLTDVVMPGMGGRELAGRLALSRPEMKVLYMSGYTEDAIVRHGMLDPGIVLLQKPFTPDALARKVREVLDELPSEVASG